MVDNRCLIFIYIYPLIGPRSRDWDKFGLLANFIYESKTRSFKELLFDSVLWVLSKRHMSLRLCGLEKEIYIHVCVLWIEVTGYAHIRCHSKPFRVKNQSYISGCIVEWHNPTIQERKSKRTHRQTGYTKNNESQSTPQAPIVNRSPFVDFTEKPPKYPDNYPTPRPPSTWSTPLSALYWTLIPLPLSYRTSSLSASWSVSDLPAWEMKTIISLLRRRSFFRVFRLLCSRWCGGLIGWCGCRGGGWFVWGVCAFLWLSFVWLRFARYSNDIYGTVELVAVFVVASSSPVVCR